MWTSNTSKLPGGYFNYEYVAAGGGTLGGGDAMASGTTEQVLLVPPGKVSLTCSFGLGNTRTPAVMVDLQDVDHYFRATTLADLGCHPNGSASWMVGGGRGKTRDAAVHALIAKLPGSSLLRARLAPIGYVDAATRTYLVDRDERPWATATVVRDGGRFAAAMDLLC